MTATTTMDWYRAKLDEAEKERDELAAVLAQLLAYTEACESLLNATPSGQVLKAQAVLDRCR